MDQTTKDNVEELYQEYMMFHSKMMDKYDLMDISSILVAQGLTFLKTILTQEAFEEFVDTLPSHKNDVQRLDPSIINYQ